MKPALMLFCLLGLALTAACASRPTLGEIPGIEQFAQPCPDEPPLLTDADVAALLQQMPTAELRERKFWGPRDLQHRRTTQCERARADGAVSAALRFNEAVRSSSR